MIVKQTESNEQMTQRNGSPTMNMRDDTIMDIIVSVRRNGDIVSILLFDSGDYGYQARRMLTDSSRKGDTNDIILLIMFLEMQL
ncbi:MAG: hypothetical protein EZS28_052755 [Streblomastix strix]|uniref:Uncharacterized protein n=1 Tax=Streblomastix strix TaxID=222440 RepID=A0A5J4RXL9_9EUKA|nr:MAG: hypothetical protein EZS28_052755 [Streblomastix strix]